MSRKIIVVGSINLDLVVRSPHLPEQGETLLGRDFRTFPGGKGANQAVAAARLGAPVFMVGRVGQDDFGAAMLRNLQAAGVDARGVERDPHAATGVALITVDDRAHNTIVVASGANLQLTPAQVLAHEDQFQEAALLVLQLEIPLPAVEQAIDLARKHGLTVLLNPAPAQPLDPALFEKVDYLIPNEGELLRLAGEKQFDLARQRLCQWGAPSLLVTLGEQGALLVDGQGEFRLPAFPVQAVDTTAAGDAFVGAFAVALSQGRPARDAVRWASAAAAISVTRPGAQPSLPTRLEVESFLSERASA